jgi:hypothetical protein
MLCNHEFIRVFFELDCYTRRKILVLFHRNKSSQNPCLKCDTLYWLQVNQSLFFFFTWSSMLSRHFFIYLYCCCRSNYQEGRGLWSHSSKKTSLSCGQQEICSSFWSLTVKQQSLAQYFGYLYTNTKSF